MIELIEIEEGLFFDPTKEWFNQQVELIDLAFAVMETYPDEMETEVFENQFRLKSGTWSYGQLLMKVTMFYAHPIESNNFLTRLKNDLVEISFVEEEIIPIADEQL